MDEHAEKRLEDYSLILVKRVEQLVIPALATFPFEDWEVYVGPNSSSSVHKRTPDAVVNFFRLNRSKTLFEHDGWEWSLRGYADSGYYTRAQDRRGIIVDKITPYVEKLKGFERKVVAVNEVLPPFERNKHHNSAFDIAQTGFQLVLNEVPGIVNLVVAETDRGFNKLQNLASVARFEYEAR